MSDSGRTRTFRVASAVGWVTFTEVIRDKVLYNIILCACLLFGVSYLAGQLTFLRPERVTLDFGMLAVNLSCTMIAVFSGASLVGKEFERRTIYVALSHPISRAQFVLGKFFGIAGVIALNWFLLSTACLLMVRFASEGNGLLGVAFFWGLILLLVQSWVVAAFAIFFSTFSTTSLSAVMTIGLFLLGNNVTALQEVAARGKSVVTVHALKAIAFVLPNFEYFGLGNRITYVLPVQHGFVLRAVLYGFGLVVATLCFAGFLIRRREV